MKPRFFASASEFRTWLSKNHATLDELLVGFYKSTAHRKGTTYQQALDEALCFGWIDGVRKNIDNERWSIRFTPRKRTSIWSLVNVRHVRRLINAGRMKPSGLEAFRTRDKAKSRIYSYEVRNRPLSPAHEKAFKANKKAWTFFLAQAPSYQKVARWRIIWAKKEETQRRRLEQLIKASEKKLRLEQFVSKK